MGVELELKLALLSAFAGGPEEAKAATLAEAEALMASQVFKLAHKAHPWRKERMDARYYDTEDLALTKAGYAYRVRAEGVRWLATVKASGEAVGGMHRRPEWTVETSSPEVDLSVFTEDQVAEKLTKAAGGKPLAQLCQTAFQRDYCMLEFADGTEVEFALDLGEVVAGGKRDPIAEVELEVRRGSAATMLVFAAQLAERFPLLPESRSKFHRALLLLGEKEEQGLPEISALHGEEPAIQEAERLLVSQIGRVFHQYAQFLHVPEDPESLHQLRVQARMLRAELSLFRKLFGTSPVDGELRAWASQLGTLRDLDVLLLSLQDLQPRADGALDALIMALAEKRRALLAETHKLLCSGSGVSVLLGLWAWVLEAASRVKSKQTFGGYCLDRLRKRLRKIISVKRLDVEATAALHAQRIEIKKLRYGVQALHDVLPSPGKNVDFLAVLKGAQDMLGDYHDAAITADVLGKYLDHQTEPEVWRGAGWLEGWRARACVDETVELEQQWEDMRKAGKSVVKGWDS